MAIALLLKERIDINNQNLYKKIMEIPFISEVLPISINELDQHKEDCLIISSNISECHELRDISTAPASSTCYVDYLLNDGKSSFVQSDSDEIIFEGELSAEHHDGLSPLGINFIVKDDISSFSKELSSVGHKLAILPKRDLTKARVPALLLDRDGVINLDVAYLHKIEDLTIYEEIVPIIQLFNEREWPVIVVTNQSGVARGRFTLNEVEDLNREINDRLLALGAKVDGWEVAPYHYEKGVGEFKKHSETRKPAPGMALIASEKFNIDFSRSVMIGDKVSDVLDHLNIFTLIIKREYDLTGAKAPVCDNYDELTSKIKNFLEIS